MLGTSCQVKYWWELTEIPQGQQHLSPWTNLSVLTFSCCCHTWYYRVLGPIPFHILTLHSVLGSELQEAVREINALKLDALLKTKSSRTNMKTDALESLGVNGKSLSWQSFNHTVGANVNTKYNGRHIVDIVIRPKPGKCRKVAFVIVLIFFSKMALELSDHFYVYPVSSAVTRRLLTLTLSNIMFIYLSTSEQSFLSHLV